MAYRGENTDDGWVSDRAYNEAVDRLESAILEEAQFDGIVALIREDETGQAWEDCADAIEGLCDILADEFEGLFTSSEIARQVERLIERNL